MYSTLSAWSKSTPPPIKKKKKLPRTDSAPESRKLLISSQQLDVRWMCLYLVNSKKQTQAPVGDGGETKLTSDTLEGESVSTQQVLSGRTPSLSHCIAKSQTKELAADLVKDMLPTCIRVIRPLPIMLTWNLYLFGVQLSLGNRSFP